MLGADGICYRRQRALVQGHTGLEPVDALHDPGRWGYPGGDLEDGEDFLAAAVRELAEETGLSVEADTLDSLGVRRFRSETCGEDDEFELFAVRTTATGDDLVCGEGRQVVFVDPDAESSAGPRARESSP